MKYRWMVVGLLLLGLVSSPVQGQVVLHEIMYNPADPLAEFLELFNAGGSAVDLQGWCIGAVDFCFDVGAAIPAGGYVVLARDATAFQTAYGALPDFTYLGVLANEGEAITLIDDLFATVDEVIYDDVGLWPITPDGLGPSLEVIDATQDNSTPRNWRASTALNGHTQGAANSVAASGLPPWITGPAHGSVDPNVPIVVTATVLDATTVDLIYRIDFGAEVTVAMADDGLNGDGLASDGVYGASIPGQPIDSLVRYRFVANGATGVQEQPRTDDTIEYLGTAVIDPALSSSLPIFHWFIDPVDFADALAHFDTDETEISALYYNGRLWDNVQIRVRGNTARTFPKKHWKFIMPQGHDFEAPDLGVPPIDRINFQGNWSDKSHMREILSYDTLEAAGSPVLITFNIRMEQNGEFFGLYNFLEQPESSWLDRIGLDSNGAHYKSFDDCRKRSVAGLADPRRYEKKSRLDEDFTDLRELVAPINDLVGVDRRNFLFDNFDLPAQLNYMASMILVHGNDHPARNYYMYRDTEGDQRWFMHVWDVDLTFGRNFEMLVLNDQIWADVDSIVGRPDVSPSHPLFGDDEHLKWDYRWNYCFDALLDEPEIRTMYLRRLRTLMDELLVAPLYENRIDQLKALIATEYDLDKTKWNQYGVKQTLTEATDIIKNDYLTPRRTHLFTTHRVPGMIPTAQSVMPPIVINEIMYNPPGGAIHEYIELFNPSTTEAIDLTDWTIGTSLVADATIPAGTVILPQGFAVLTFDDLAFRTQYGAGIFMPGEYATALDNNGREIALRDHLGNLIDQVTYGDVAPWPTTPDGSGPSLALCDPALDNALPASWRASPDPGGTPGQANGICGAIAPELYINEVVPVNSSINADTVGDFDPWLEIYNASATTVDMSGMFLSNTTINRAQWAFPAGTMICSECYLLVWMDGEPGEGALHANFTLDALGGDIFLWTSAQDEIDSLTYPALAADTAYGRNPDGSVVIEELFVPTPEGANMGEPAMMILNEYNAVSSGNVLENSGSDPTFGQIPGNGGDWFELVVVKDHVDIRGWKLMISNDTGTVDQTITELVFSSDTIWSDLRCGTIITVSEDQLDDISYDPIHGDWTINVQAALGNGTYITASNFPVTSSRWQLTIKNALDEVVFGPAGEGIVPASGIGSDEIFKLEEDPNMNITPFSNYNDGSSSTWGLPNVWAAGTMTQDFTPLWEKVGSVVSVAFDNPANGSAHPENSTLALEVTASSSNSTITGVEFFYDNGGGPVSLGVDTTEPYAIDWPSVALGDYVVTATATDGFSTMNSAVISVKVREAPLVELTSPDAGILIVGTTVSLQANASDVDGGIAQVEFFVDSGSGPVSLGVDTTLPYGVNTASLPLGDHTLTAVATDIDGLSTTSAAVEISIRTLEILTDGFESGSVSNWTSAVGVLP